MSKAEAELERLLQLAPGPVNSYVEQLASLSAGTAGLSRLLNGFDQQLQRLEQFHAHSAREMALEIAAVNRAAAKRRAGTVPPELQGWRKVSADGEVLKVDSEEWDAVLDTGYELMWTVNTSLRGEVPHRCGRSVWKMVQDRLAQLNIAGWCGFRDWRVPTLNELRTLQYSGKRLGEYQVSTALFPDMQEDAEYWSCSADSEDSQYLQTFQFTTQQTAWVLPAFYACVRFVRSAPAYG